MLSSNGRQIGSIDGEQDFDFFDAEPRPGHFAPVAQGAGLDWIGTTEALRPKRREPPEHIKQIVRGLIDLDLGARLLKPSVPFPAGLAVLVRCVVPDGDRYSSPEPDGELGEKFAILFAASTTWAKIQPCSSRRPMAFFIDSSGTSPL